MFTMKKFGGVCGFLKTFCFLAVLLVLEPTKTYSLRLPHLPRLSAAALRSPTDTPLEHRSLLTQYNDWVEHRPLIAKSLTAGVVSGAGDVLAQYLELGGRGHLDMNRLCGFFLANLLFVGPFLHYWYDFLWAMGRWMEDRRITQSKGIQTTAQVIVDQTIGVFIFFPVYFFVYEIIGAFCSLRRPALGLTYSKMAGEIYNVFLTQYYIWPAFNWINFAFVPQNLRILTSNIVAVFWNAYLCTRVAN